MTSAVITCRPEDSLGDAERLMEDRMVRRLVVVDDQRKPVGILSLDDLATVPTEVLHAGEVLEHMRPHV
jgi:CBS domain-containing protein